jgi:hypothetical protein
VTEREYLVMVLFPDGTTRALHDVPEPDLLDVHFDDQGNDYDVAEVWPGEGEVNGRQIDYFAVLSPTEADRKQPGDNRQRFPVLLMWAAGGKAPGRFTAICHGLPPVGALIAVRDAADPEEIIRGRVLRTDATKDMPITAVEVLVEYNDDDPR